MVCLYCIQETFPSIAADSVRASLRVLCCGLGITDKPILLIDGEANPCTSVAHAILRLMSITSSLTRKLVRSCCKLIVVNVVLPFGHLHSRTKHQPLCGNISCAGGAVSHFNFANCNIPILGWGIQLVYEVISIVGNHPLALIGPDALSQFSVIVVGETVLIEPWSLLHVRRIQGRSGNCRPYWGQPFS